MVTAIVIILYVIVILLDFMASGGSWPMKERVVYWAVLALSFSGMLMASLGIQVPGPSGVIRNIVEFIVPGLK